VVLAPFGEQVEIALGEQRAVLAGVGGVGLAVEPMTYPPKAFGSGDDLIVLEPGGSFQGV
jgi:aldose 1-epimerase